MSNAITQTVNVSAFDHSVYYKMFEQHVKDCVINPDIPLFQTDVDAEEVWSTYINNIPTEYRQHYNCNCCKNFIKRYGNLVTLTKTETGSVIVESVLWKRASEQMGPFGVVNNELRTLVLSKRISNVFSLDTKEFVIGNPEAGGWTHLHKPIKRECKFINRDKLLTASQKEAEYKQDFIMLKNVLIDFPLSVISDAYRVVKSGHIEQASISENMVEWLLDLSKDWNDQNNKAYRDLLVWLAVATAPRGYAHIRNTILGELMAMLKEGKTFDQVNVRWKQMVNPLNYQRPKAAPSEGAIDRAEDIFNKLNLQSSLDRRYARFEEIPSFVWRPNSVEQDTKKYGLNEHGIFGELRPGKNKKGYTPIELPASKMTVTEFLNKLTNEAASINKVEIKPNLTSNAYFGFLTASDPESEPILQWDCRNILDKSDEGNPVSWYFNSAITQPTDWNLSHYTWTECTGICKPPYMWGISEVVSKDLYSHLPTHLFLILKDCRPKVPCSLGLFPAILKNELREVRSVIEAYSNKNKATGSELASACGIALSVNGTGRDTETFNIRINGTDLYSVVVTR